MLKTLHQSILLITLAVTVLTSSGCFALLVGAAAGAGGVAYAGGSLEKNFDKPIKTIHKAAMAALKREDVFVKTDELNFHSAKIQGEYEDGKKVVVTIEALTSQIPSNLRCFIRTSIINDNDVLDHIFG